MNPSSVPLPALGLAFAGLAAVSSAQAPEKTEMHESVTQEQLVENMRKGPQQDPLKSFKRISGEDPSVVNRPSDLISRSEILSFNGIATLLPKRSVLQIPKSLVSRMGLQDGVKIKTWTDFYSVNRNWITTVEVSRAQAEGKLPMAEDTQTQISKSGSVVVATYNGNPISVLPLKVPPPDAAAVSPVKPAKP